MFRSENPPGPQSRIAPRRYLVGLVPHPNLPPVRRARFQRRAAVLDVDGLVGHNLTGIPDARDFDLIGVLTPGVQHPTQSWLFDVEVPT